MADFITVHDATSREATDSVRLDVGGEGGLELELPQPHRGDQDNLDVRMRL